MVTKALNSIEERAVTSLENMKTTQREFADRLLQIEQKGSGAGIGRRPQRSPGGANAWREGLGGDAQEWRPSEEDRQAAPRHQGRRRRDRHRLRANDSPALLARRPA